MWELDHKESWAPKNWCFWTVLLEKTLESPLNCKEVKAVNPKGNRSWIFIGRTDAEAETPILWPPETKNWLIWKDPDARKDCRREEKGMTGWDGWMASPTQWTWVWVNSRSWWWKGGLVCCSPWGRKESDTTEQLKGTDVEGNVKMFKTLLGFSRSSRSSNIEQEDIQIVIIEHWIWGAIPVTS